MKNEIRKEIKMAKRDLELELKILRDNIDIIKYEELKEKDHKNLIYGWIFQDNIILRETIKELKKTFSKREIAEIVDVYIKVLQLCQKGGNK